MLIRKRGLRVPLGLSRKGLDHAKTYGGDGGGAFGDGDGGGGGGDGGSGGGSGGAGGGVGAFIDENIGPLQSTHSVSRVVLNTCMPKW